MSKPQKMLFTSKMIAKPFFQQELCQSCGFVCIITKGLRKLAPFSPLTFVTNFYLICCIENWHGISAEGSIRNKTNFTCWQCFDTKFLNGFLRVSIVRHWYCDFIRLIVQLGGLAWQALETHSGPENLKKSRPKKLVKSNKSISRKKNFHEN